MRSVLSDLPGVILRKRVDRSDNTRATNEGREGGAVTEVRDCALMAVILDWS